MKRTQKTKQRKRPGATARRARQLRALERLEAQLRSEQEVHATRESTPVHLWDWRMYHVADEDEMRRWKREAGNLRRNLGLGSRQQEVAA